MLLLDAGVWVASVAAEEAHHRDAAGLVGAKDLAVAALDLTLYEIANAVGCKQGQPREAERLVRLVLKRCPGRLVAVGRELVADAVEIAGDHGISAYDAAYVAAARRNGWTLVSTDFRDLVHKGLAVAPDAALYP